MIGTVAIAQPGMDHGLDVHCLLQWLLIVQFLGYTPHCWLCWIDRICLVAIVYVVFWDASKAVCVHIMFRACADFYDAGTCVSLGGCVRSIILLDERKLLLSGAYIVMETLIPMLFPFWGLEGKAWLAWRLAFDFQTWRRCATLPGTRCAAVRLQASLRCGSFS